MPGQKSLLPGLSLWCLFQFQFIHHSLGNANGKPDPSPNSVVHSVIYDDKKGKATGVRVVDANTKEMTEYYATHHFLECSLSEYQPHCC